jgi:thioredoxin 1
MSNIKFSTIDIEEQPDIAARYKVRSVPTVIIEKDDIIVQTFVGLQSKQTYIQAIDGANHEG